MDSTNQDAVDVAATLATGERLLATDPPEAAEHARRVLAAAPRNADAYRLLGAALRRLGDDSAANEAELAAIRASGSDPELVRAGQALFNDDFPTAEAILRPILQRRPNDVAAIRMLGEVAASVGLLGNAETLFRRALELAPGFAFARLHLAMTLHRQNRFGEALTELATLTGPEWDEDEVRNLRASVLSRVGELDQAIALYRESLARNPGKAELLITLGFLHRTVGDVDEAMASFRQAISLRPTFGEAWFNLANLKTITFSDADVAAMESALAQPDISDDDRLHLHFALGKAFEDRGDDERSFDHYRQGNAIRAGQLHHDPAKVTAIVEESEHIYTRELLDSRADWGCPAPDPIFILGMPRSGSTLVEQILASHPMIEGTGELADIIVLATSLEPSPAQEAGVQWQRYPAVVADLPAEELMRLGELYIERTRVQRKTDKPFFIDKMPNNWIHTGFIRLILPHAKIIDARRHPLACGFSNFKQHFARGQEFAYDLEHFGLYFRDYVRLMRHFDEVAPGAVHRVIHEQLVADPEAEVRKLLDYLGLPFDEVCLRFHESKRAVRTASSEQVRRPIDAESADQWRRFEQWLDPLKHALGPTLERWAS